MHTVERYQSGRVWFALGANEPWWKFGCKTSLPFIDGANVRGLSKFAGSFGRKFTGNWVVKNNERRIITLLNVRGNAAADPGISRPGARYYSWGLGIVLMYPHTYYMYM